MPFLYNYHDKSGKLSLARFFHFYLQKLSPSNLTQNIQTPIGKEYPREGAWKIPSFLTIEASLCLTVFLVFMISFCQLFLVMQLQLRVQKALEQVGNEAAQYSYLSSQVDLWDSDSQLISQIEEYLLAELSQEAFRIRFVDVMGMEALEHSVLVGGADGVSFEESSILEEHHRMRLVVSYRVRLPVTLFGIGDFTLRQQCYRYAMLGDHEPSEEVETTEQMVYVTKDGQVYHVTLSCTYLNLSVRSVSMAQVDELRNEGGAKYYACELCEPNGHEAAVYLTNEGTRYHSDRGCSGIQRYISSVPISEAASLRPCSRCGQEE